MRLRALLKNQTMLEQLLAYAILGMTLGIMLATVWPSLNNTGYLSAWDAGGHLLKANYFAHHLLTHGHLSGWFPLWHGGFDLFQFYPPLLYYLLGPLTLIFPPELALRLITAALWLGLVPATYYFLRSFKLDRLISAIGASFLLALNASFGIGLGALYGVGLLPNGLGAILAIWTLGRLKRDLSQPDRQPYQFLLTGALVGFLILAHTFSAYWWILASLVLVVSELLGGDHHLKRVSKRYGFVLAVALLVSAYWWIPLVANLGSMGTTGNIQQSPKADIAKELLLAKDSGGIVMVLLAAGGLGFLGFRRDWRTFGFFGTLLVISFLLSLNLINAALPFHSIVGSSQFIRFHAFFSWLLMVLAVFGLAGIWYLLRRARVPYVPAVSTASVALILFALVILPTLDKKRGFVHVSDNSATTELRGAADYLTSHQRPGDFVLTEFNWDARLYYGSPHFVNQHLPLLANNTTWDLDGNFPEGTIGAEKPVLIASVLDQTDYVRTNQLYLQSRGIRYLVSDNNHTRLALEAEPWLTKVWEGRIMSVFELRSFDHRFGLPAEVSDQVKEVSYRDPGDYIIRFNQPVALQPNTTVALSYHQWMQAFADGRRLKTGGDDESRLTLQEGAAQPVSELRLRYRPGASAIIGSAISVLALLGVAVFLAKPRWPTLLLEVAKRRNGGRGRRRQKTTPRR